MAFTGSPPVTRAPAGGKGVALDWRGNLPLAVRKQLPGYEYGYAEFTALFTTTATSEATAGIVVAAPTLIFDGATRVKIEFFAMTANVGTSLRWVALWLYEDQGSGATSIGQIGEQDVPTGGYGGPVSCSRLMTPILGSHVFSIRASVGGGAGTAVIGADVGGTGKNMPGYIRITRA